MPDSQRFVQSSRGPRGRWPRDLQRRNGQCPQRGFPAAQPFSFLQVEDADEDVEAKKDRTVRGCRRFVNCLWLVCALRDGER